VESLVYLFTPLISTVQNIPQIWHTDVQDREIFAKLEMKFRILFAVQLV
jgi:hypothetical protein